MKKKLKKIINKESLKKNKKKVIAGIFGLFVIVVGAVLIVSVNKSKGSGENVVYVNKVSDITNPSISSGRVNRFAGVVETQKEIKIQPEEGRGIEKIHVKAGDEVEVGTLLFTYANTETTDKLDQAKIDLERISNAIENKKTEINQISDNLDKLEAQGELKKSELELKAKNIEIEKLQAALDNVEVKSEMAGVVKELNPEGGFDNYSGQEKPFMSIISLGEYRIKGKINEQNLYDFMPGQEVIIYSRVDDNITWKGTISEINTSEPQGNQFDYMGGDGMTSSNSYPFYVELSSSEGLMLGQHVYIEPDFGQGGKKDGLWLDASYVVEEDNNAYVWADNGNGKLEKRKVKLGEFDENLFSYKIESGLTEDDLITFNEFGLKEKMKTKPGNNNMYGMSNPPEQEFDNEDNMIMEDMPEEMLEENQADTSSNISSIGGVDDPDEIDIEKNEAM